jgi:hypothetical protein
MKRQWPWFLVLAAVTVAALFFGGYLTGSVNHELQDPYSRTTRIMGSRFGFSYDRIVPNEMSAYYFDALKQPRAYRWEPGENSYRIEKGTGAITFEDRPIAPVLFLKPVPIEVAFLRQLPDNRTRLAVIHSLFQPRKQGREPQAFAWNRQEAERERERVNRILSWYEFDRKDYSIPFRQWWRDNAQVFGLKEDGSPLAPTPERKAAIPIRSSKNS